MSKFIIFNDTLLNLDYILSFELQDGQEEAEGKYFIFANLAIPNPDDEVSQTYIRWIFTDKTDRDNTWKHLFRRIMDTI